MFKKVFGTLAALAFVFGAIPHTNIFKGLANVCTSICSCHNGDGWSN